MTALTLAPARTHTFRPGADDSPAPSPHTLDELGERIAELSARINVARHEMLMLIVEFDRLDGWAGAGFSSCVDWLAWRTAITPVTARHQIRVAHALTRLPKTSEAMRQGLVSYTKVREITRVATRVTEQELLTYAQSGSAVQLRAFVRGWKRMEREGEISAEEIRHRSRKLSVVVDGEGMYVVRGRLEPEAGAALMRAIEAADDAIYRDEDPEARPTGEQRRADAAGMVAERALAAGFADAASGARAERYQVVVHTEAATLVERGETGRSELDGVRVCAETSRRMACDAAVVRMAHGRAGEVLSVGRRTRTIPPHIRRALEERDRGCRYPGCGSRFTEAHHVRHWADGGETSLANTVLLCRRHHRLVHEGRAKMALDRHGTAVFFTKRGRSIGSVPPAVAGPVRRLPRAPREPAGRLWNGAGRYARVPERTEIRLREALEGRGDGRDDGGEPGGP